MGQRQLRNGESGTLTPRGGGRDCEKPGIRAGGNVEGLMALDGTVPGLKDVTLVTGKVREGESRMCLGLCTAPPQKVSRPAGHWRCTTRVQTIDWDGKLQEERIRS